MELSKYTVCCDTRSNAEVLHTNIYICLNQHLVDIPFFAACISSLEANDKIVLRRFGLLFNALNTNTLQELFRHIYNKKINTRQRFNMVKQIRDGLDYFQYPLDEFRQLVDTHEQLLYVNDVNIYIMDKLQQYSNLTISPNMLYSKELYARFPDRIIMDKFNQDFANNMTLDTVNHIHSSYPKAFYTLAINPHADIPDGAGRDHLIAQGSANMKLIDAVVANNEYKLIRALENKYIDESFIERHYNHILIYIAHTTQSKIRCNWRVLTNVLMKYKEFDKWSCVSVEFLPVDIIIKYSRRLDFTYAHCNNLLTTEIYDIIKFNDGQYLQLQLNDKLSEEFIHKNAKYMMCFNINNSRISEEFIISHANIINSKTVCSRRMTNTFAAKLLDAIVERKKTTGIHIEVLVQLMNHLDIDAQLVFNTLARIYNMQSYNPIGYRALPEFGEVNRFEFIDKSMCMFDMFKHIPFAIYKKYNILTKFENIKLAYDSKLRKLTA